MRLIKIFGDSYRITDDMGSLKRRISDLTRKRETYGIGNFNEPPQGGGNISSLKMSMRGLGKTAIARKLYNSGDVKRRFEYRTWTYVSQEYKTRDMLVRIIRSLGIAIEIELKMFSEEELEDYLNDILDGQIYFVVVDDIWEMRKVMSCRIHDLLRDVAIKKSKEINFVHVYNGQHSSTTCRREVVHYLINNNDLCDRHVNKRMRSFLFFGEKKGMLGVFVQTITLNLKLLRVLNLGGLLFLCKGYVPLSLPDAIGDLIHLRYLGVADAGRRNIPTFISNLQFLQTLDASGFNYFKGTTDL
ncbi:unnamed protein product, partial [Brassica rapa subsp. trilocularis]